jgi:FkbM family methyltransferase
MMDLRLKLRNFIFRILNYVENNNNAIIRHNGEHSFLANAMKTFRGNAFILFDVGANVGDFSISAIRSFRQVHNNKSIVVHAFEPIPSAFGQLQAALQNEKDCFVVNTGISETEGQAEMFLTDTADKCASLYKRHELAPSRATTIGLRRLDTYIESLQIEKIDLLKIDTEGHELAVLKSAGKYLNPDTIHTIQFEYGGTYLDARIYLKDIYTLLESKGYEIYKIYPRRLKRRDYHPAMENFQYANFVAMAKSVKHD